MRRALLIAALVLASGATDAAAASPPAGCGPDAARTVAASRLTRVYVTRPKSGGRRLYACLRSGSRPVLVTELYDRSYAVAALLLRGRYVTAHTTSCEQGRSCDYNVFLVDVQKRRALAGEAYRRGRIEKLVATRRGQAAFLARDEQLGTRIVEKLDDFGGSIRDRGDALHGLRLAGARISWFNGEEARAEPIAHVRRCGPGYPAYSQEIARHARVYAIDPDGDYERTEWFACLYSGGRPLYLGSDLLGNSAYGYHGSFQVSGGYVGWFEYDCFPGDCNATLRIADLRRHTIRSGRYGLPGTLLLNRRGFAAVVTRQRYTDVYLLNAFDSAGERQIDSGEGIDPASVALHWNAITWRHGGEERREELR